MTDIIASFALGFAVCSWVLLWTHAARIYSLRQEVQALWDADYVCSHCKRELCDKCGGRRVDDVPEVRRG